MTLFARVNRRSLTWHDMYGEGAPPSTTNSGTKVSEITSLKYSVVWASVGLITDAVCFLTPEAFSVNPDTGKVEPRPTPRWIESPHPEIRRSDLWAQLLVSVLLWGNGYALIIRRQSDGQIVGLYPLRPQDVNCVWELDAFGFSTGVKKYQVMGGRWLSSADILHIQGPTLPGEPKGMSVITQAKEAVGLGLTLEEFGARYFAQGSMAKVVISVPTKLDEKQALDLVKTYERFHKGPGNWHRPAVLSGKDAHIENISIPPEDAQFLESREFQAVDVARWFRVPPHRVGIISKQSSWGSGLSEENMAMVQHTFRPWIRRFEEVLTAYAPGGEDRGLRVRLQEAELLRGTFKEQVDAWGAAVEKQIATPNEARKALGLDPIAGGDKLVVPPAPQQGFGQDKPQQKPNQPPKQQQPDQQQQKGARFNDNHDELGRFSSGDTISAGGGAGGYAKLSPKGQAAIDAAMAKYGLTPEALDAEIQSMMTPENIAAGQTWYSDAQAYNQAIADQYGLSLQQATGITSACSPRCPWAQNQILTDRVASEYGNYPDLPAQEAAARIGGGLSANMGVGVEIARGEAIDEVLTGIKRRSFYNNMLKPGETEDVTIDAWMQRSVPRASTIEGLTDKDALAFVNANKVTTGGGAGYVAISDSVRRVAAANGLAPDAAQAAYWVGIRGSGA